MNRQESIKKCYFDIKNRCFIYKISFSLLEVVERKSLIEAEWAGETLVTDRKQETLQLF